MKTKIFLSVFSFIVGALFTLCITKNSQTTESAKQDVVYVDNSVEAKIARDKEYWPIIFKHFSEVYDVKENAKDLEVKNRYTKDGKQYATLRYTFYNHPDIVKDIRIDNATLIEEHISYYSPDKKGLTTFSKFHNTYRLYEDGEKELVRAQTLNEREVPRGYEKETRIYNAGEYHWTMVR